MLVSMMRQYFVYILASRKNGTLYIGVTNDLERRVWQHKTKATKGFTEKYNVCNLVYFEQSPSITDAIDREKCLKRWKRDWKLRLIESVNPNWTDLSGFLPSQE
jgi:putative endonuclease